MSKPSISWSKLGLFFVYGCIPPLGLVIFVSGSADWMMWVAQVCGLWLFYCLVLLIRKIFSPSPRHRFDVEEVQFEPQEKQRKRRVIPQDVKDKVWQRAKGKCEYCGNNKNLEFDHIVPWSKGGSNTYRNLQLLCQGCNRSKGSKIGR